MLERLRNYFTFKENLVTLNIINIQINMQKNNKKNIYNIKPDFQFIDNLVLGIKNRYPDKETLSIIKIFLPTKKTANSLKKSLLKEYQMDNKHLPDIVSLGDSLSLENFFVSLESIGSIVFFKYPHCRAAL